MSLGRKRGGGVRRPCAQHEPLGDRYMKADRPGNGSRKVVCMTRLPAAELPPLAAYSAGAPQGGLVPPSWQLKTFFLEAPWGHRPYETATADLLVREGVCMLLC